MMLWVWFAIGLVLFVGGLTLAIVTYSDVSEVFFFPASVALIGLILTCVFGVMLIQQHYARVSCHTFSVNTGRRTKFVHYTAYSWDCLTPTKGGQWIPTKNLREFGAQP